MFPEGDKFRVEYGRIDSTKTTRYYPISKFESQAKSKIKKGYVDVTDLKKDLVEEIFGDIQDEHDHNALVARKLNENTFEFSGRMEIEEINESHHLDLPESDDYQTIAGLLLNHLGAIPNEGDTVDFDSFKVTVLKKNAARVELVRLVVNPSANHK